MGSLCRSQEMIKLRLFVEKSVAHETMVELAELGVFQLNDLNEEKSTFQRTFAADVRLCDEMQRRLRFLEEQVDFQLEEQRLEDTITVEALQSLQLEELARYLCDLEGNVTEMNSHWGALKAEERKVAEHAILLQAGAKFFEDAPKVSLSEYGTTIMSPDPEHRSINIPRSSAKNDEETTSLLGVSKTGRDGMEESILGYYAGFISFENIHPFERILFRVSRGNAYLRLVSLDEISSVNIRFEKMENEWGRKRVFIVFFPGVALGTKILKICEAFSVSLYNLPEGEVERYRLLQSLEQEFNDLQTVIASTQSQREEAFREIALQLSLWKEKVRREKTIFHALNLLNYDTSNNVYIADGWCPLDEYGNLQDCLSRAQKRAHAQSPTVVEVIKYPKDTPPTFYKLNKFTIVFQNVVESYGVPCYQELNPAPFTIVTFPFLFAIMFGDIGHGMLMTLVAAILIFKEKQLGGRKLNELVQTCFDGRYMILLMGLFSVYTGFIYNECFGVSLNLFQTRWKFTDASSLACGVDSCADALSNKPPLDIYPFGFDPVWSRAQNGLSFLNSYKMKLSIIVGVTQMLLGIVLSYFNASFFRSGLDIWYVFVPQLLFMSCTFGYLVLLIFIKWLTNWNAPSCLSDSRCRPPDLKNTLIGLFMTPYKVAEDAKLFPFQGEIQSVLLLIAIVSVPWMLLPKPLILLYRHRKSKIVIGNEEQRPLLDKELSTQTNNHVQGGTHSDMNKKEEESFDFGEVMIHQLIHTIEFVLGAVSNTASYLRLWALSLAHSELSLVFLEKVLYNTISLEHPIAIMIGFLLWAFLTIGVLCLMESLSAFLHALRLHWVEFQNKFYNLQGEGRKFIPMSFSI
ncbi:V-type proton ATPase subunit a2 [Galdieria sulphuraria]|uniref:V-type proton ATPase subunit a n=1 Tax=Galdieria sulphuraria TaxID=130081 RepID=M2Y228_GALSU|nr:F-type H+-transporting ATPase subunit a [Galdieria sulphuraria]EME29854.1 F-type H+-transporting ATPase subunit a [Galdieria sulphuraria]GJD06843.1 V-type proton ATPase subunit a2 [Galdieria sulphuraria]|eukprot:XP_005706374.1 F-type H+-transporting ATPase subunit a [Galdieria sulphuraria]